ncbi:patatin-like phospholipase family protein [Vibrio sp. 10N.261.51.F12]|uniref:patatin-like phospholipase family protein n=1 Tax=Vibrio sp. 10N.261.51.F12 TaxID=3229679 RepID=UPI0035538C73
MKNFIIVMLSLAMMACSTTHSIDKRVTEQNYTKVTLTKNVAVSPDAHFEEPYRFFGDEVPPFLAKLKEERALNELVDTPNAPQIVGNEFDVLVLSGGGERGAYGAGIVNGLYDNGNLPEFSLVTGVSTGALTAPFVFAGGEYIHKLKDAMLALNDGLLDKRGLLWPAYSTSMVKGKTFYQFIEDTYDDDLIEAIAREYNKGKRLQIGTTHFDSGRQMIWNVGRIASSDLPNKAELIHKILMASASIPGFFPPQYFTVYDHGKAYEEMHVDGGLSHQLFFNTYGFDLKSASEAYGVSGTPNIYIIRNGFLHNDFKQVENKILAIGARSIDNLIFSQTLGDLYKEIYLSGTANANAYLTNIEKDFDVKTDESKFFDENYMKALYDYGYDKAKSGQLWTATVKAGEKIEKREDELHDEMSVK